MNLISALINRKSPRRLFASTTILCIYFLIQSFPSLGQQPKVLGSLPRDGATNIVCNAFVAVGVEFGDKGIGLNESTMTDETVRLYLTQFPDSTIQAFKTYSKDLKNITLEPFHVLKPNTSYSFEITSDLKDEKDNPFQPYRIVFTTGEVALKKHITLVRNKPKPKRKPTTPRPPGYASNKSPKAIPVDAAKKDDQTIAVVDKKTPAIANTPSEKTEAIETIEKPKVDKTIIRAIRADIKHDLVEIKWATAQESSNSYFEIERSSDGTNFKSIRKIETDEETATGKKYLMSDPDPIMGNNFYRIAIKDDRNAIQYSKVMKVEYLVEESIVFLKNSIIKNGKIPISFTIGKTQSVKFIIKSPSGRVVKRGSGNIPAGQEVKLIPLEGISPGKYKISIKMGERVESHVFNILN